ncbi:MAG: winged helix-turn-helix domain-containing protein [Candidatus Nanohaloarchaea archaeon]
MRYFRLHPIQEKILKRLSYDLEEKTFSEIRGDIESNKFAFHLKKLQERDMIEKTKDGYLLSSQGREILPHLDLEESYHPVIAVDILVFSEDKVYLLPKDEDPLDPFTGDYRALSSRVSGKERLLGKPTRVFIDEFGEKPDSLQPAAIFDSQVTFLDGSKQHYLLFYFKAAIDRPDDENWFKMDELESIDLLPGLEKTAKEIKEHDGLIMGTWDIKETEDGFEVEKLEF